MLHTMSTTPETDSVRSAADVNEEIRALWFRAGGTLSMEERREYQRLVLEWAEAAPQSPIQAA
ncbi:hypothetical protein ACGFY3_41480 [Streptomyces mirabilis]|jgi:hypothetical protein|uniref:hypothetical protein n=1 Tax=Streptomyces TaxID=1883 RepID=UPI000BB0D85A|nr:MULTISPECIES: hypothetical protein [Streptomyces]MCT9108185.1 hypothetical protein [Streptomyces mirabilis]PBC93871.1 hypothetical protein BX281_1739 [Streptomyces sp. Ag82_O1-15]SOE48910.1 hypothetical protein SAMN05446589_0237 [Streptomyces sp. OV198]